MDIDYFFYNFSLFLSVWVQVEIVKLKKNFDIGV